MKVPSRSLIVFTASMALLAYISFSDRSPAPTHHVGALLEVSSSGL